jgi:hypothetical protein
LDPIWNENGQMHRHGLSREMAMTKKKRLINESPANRVRCEKLTQTTDW